MKAKTIRCWEDLLEQAHELAKEKGWWDNPDRPVDEQVANFHSEISEAWEEYRANRVDTWYSLEGKPLPLDQTLYGDKPLKPEGFWVEIADLLVRIADSCGRYGWTPKWGLQGHDAQDSFATLVCCLNACVADMRGFDEWKRDSVVEEQIEGVTSLVDKAAKSRGIDIWPIVNEKMAYNRTRPHRHGGKLA